MKKLEIVKVNTGFACGKQMLRVTDDDKLLGWVQPTNLSFECVLGTTMVYVCKRCGGDYGISVKDTLFDAISYFFDGLTFYDFVRISLPKGIFNEFWSKRI